MNSQKRIRFHDVERKALYGALILFLGYHIASFYVDLERFTPHHSLEVFVGVTIVIGIHQVLSGLDEISQMATTETPSAVIHHASFSEAFSQFVAVDEPLEDLWIAAYTSRAWQEQIRLQHRSIRRVRVLLCQADRPPFGVGSSGLTIPDVLARWQASAGVEQQRIAELEVRRVKADTHFYFGILNGKRLLIGLLWPQGMEGLDRLQPRDAIVCTSLNEHSRQLLQHMLEWFERMWREGERLL